MRVLCACEESQEVCFAFRCFGHEAFSCDLEDCSGGFSEWHLKTDVLSLLNENWDIIIAFPPCTYMSKAGARFMYDREHNLNLDRFKKALAAKEFFYQFYNCNCQKICIENPTPLKVVGLPEPTQIIQPYMFGEPYSKRTLLWLKGLPELKPTKILNDFSPYIPSNTSEFSKGKGGSYGVAHSTKKRSKTFQGIAAAMAEQWGNV